MKYPDWRVNAGIPPLVKNMQKAVMRPISKSFSNMGK